VLFRSRSVNGRIAIVCSSTIDLKPEMDRDVIAGGVSGNSLELPFDFDIRCLAFHAMVGGVPLNHYRKKHRISIRVRRCMKVQKGDSCIPQADDRKHKS